MNVRCCTLCLALLVALPAVADIYKYVDENGHVTYSNVPVKGAKKLELDPLNAVAMPRNKAGGSTASNVGPAEFPKVDGETQKKRDMTRRAVLEEELKNEEALLAQATKALADQESVRNGDEKNYQKVLERLAPFRDQVLNHQKNIEAIKKELANTK